MKDKGKQKSVRESVQMGEGQTIDGNNHQRLIGAGVGLDVPETAAHSQMIVRLIDAL